MEAGNPQDAKSRGAGSKGLTKHRNSAGSYLDGKAHEILKIVSARKNEEEKDTKKPKEFVFVKKGKVPTRGGGGVSG